MTRGKAAFLLISLALASCAKSNHFAVDGVEGAFCVPPTGYIAPGVWFVPEDPKGMDLGFSFGGCHRLPASERASCTLPESFLGADVSPLSVKRSEIWSELKEAAAFKLVVEAPDTQYNIDPETGFLVIYNRRVWKQWLVWKRASPESAQAEIRLADPDLLVVSCSEAEDFPRSAGLGGPDVYGCERYVRGQQYALTYRFMSKQRVPSESLLKGIEAALFEQIELWRCSE
jgi:hypothetical protein